MPDFVTIGEFSRQNCIGICAVLIPANLIATLLTLIFVFWDYPRHYLRFSVTIAISFAIILSLHVASWWMIGVIQAPTFILLALATVCLGLNSWAMVQKGQWKKLIFQKIKSLSYNL